MSYDKKADLAGPGIGNYEELEMTKTLGILKRL